MRCVKLPGKDGNKIEAFANPENQAGIRVIIRKLQRGTEEIFSSEKNQKVLRIKSLFHKCLRGFGCAKGKFFLKMLIVCQHASLLLQPRK